MGVNGTTDFLLRCGYCRTSVWGKSYVEWYDKAVNLLILNNTRTSAGKEHINERQHALDEAYELAMDLTSAVIRCGGGGMKQNAILGRCLSLVGSVVYEQQQNSNDGVPCNTLAGQICRTAVHMGAPPSGRIAWVLSEMRWIFEQKEEQKYWLDLAIKCCEEWKQCIPEKSTALLMRASCISIDILVQYPDSTIEDVLKVVQHWPWDVEELTVEVLCSVCCTLLDNGGACYMAQYLERGERLVAEDPNAKNPRMFDKLRLKYEESLVQ